MKDDDYDYDDDENVLGVVVIRAYNNNTYMIQTSLDVHETTQLVVDAGDDLIEGRLEGLEDFSHGEIPKSLH
jgi:hypothetical protein